MLKEEKKKTVLRAWLCVCVVSICWAMRVQKRVKYRLLGANRWGKIDIGDVMLLGGNKIKRVGKAVPVIFNEYGCARM